MGQASLRSQFTAQALSSERLRAFHGSSPYFEQRRLAFLVAVQGALTTGATPGLIARVRGLLADPVRAFNRWVMVEPNFMGIGVRVNKIIEDVVGKKPSKSDSGSVPVKCSGDQWAGSRDLANSCLNAG